MLLTLASVFGQAVEFTKPNLDYHALAPEIVLLVTIIVVTLVDLVKPEGNNPLVPALTGLGLLGTLIPLLTLHADDGGPRALMDGAFVVDDFALILKAMFIIAAYVVVLMSTNYIAEGDYAEGEYYTLLLSSVGGMVLMASARDLITVFIALELLSIPAYMLAGWRKRDLIGNEAGAKYYLMGVFASAIMLYGMSLLFGVSGGQTNLVAIGESIAGDAGDVPVVTLAIVFVLIGFAFKVSAVPFHTWAPDTYEGAPTPITAFLAVASKAAGFVALLQLIFLAFFPRADVVQPLMWVLAAATMTVGNMIALRQTNIIRMLAYSGVAQAGFMLAPLAVAGATTESSGFTYPVAPRAIVTYLVIYTAMNLGAFAVVIAIARKTRSAEISSFGGLFTYAPALTVLLTLFLVSLMGIPPLGGWLAKFVVFKALADAGTVSAYVLGVVVAVNSVIAAFYYLNVAREMWFNPVPDEDTTPVKVPFALSAASVICIIATVLFGITNWATELGDEAIFTVLGG